MAIKFRKMKLSKRPLVLAKKSYKSLSKSTRKMSPGNKKYDKFRRGIAGGIESTLPAKVPGVKKEKSKRAKKSKYVRTGRSAGRPEGVYKHFIITPQGERKYVHVYEWRRWVRRQKALQRLSGSSEEKYPTQPRQEEYPKRREQEPPKREEQDHILNAPNVFRGELKDVGSVSAIQHMDTINKPVINSEGEYFTDVDPFTGKHIVRRRVKERWTHGG